MPIIKGRNKRKGVYSPPRQVQSANLYRRSLVLLAAGDLIESINARSSPSIDSEADYFYMMAIARPLQPMVSWPDPTSTLSNCLTNDADYRRLYFRSCVSLVASLGPFPYSFYSFSRYEPRG